MNVGQTLGHYTIVRALGRGGMGEVYVAQDLKLNRQVALKVLPADVAADAERLERFRREAHAVAALNHPNIVTIHSVEDAAGVHFITLELVEGRTLDQVIGGGRMPIDLFFKLAIPLVDAVSAAHERGIVHRDLKPANVMVTPDERVKVLDFGLAKLLESPVDDAAQTATAGAHLTGEGRVLGTVAYMSPEQAEAKPLDHRTDIFSLGIVLHEMATGERPFKGDTRMSVLSSILRDKPPPVSDLNTQLPRHLGRIIRKALEKSVTRRYQSALELRNDLDELKHEIDTGEILVVRGNTISDPEGVHGPTAGKKRTNWVLPAAGFAITLLVVAAVWWMGWPGQNADGPPAFTVARVTTTGQAAFPTLSADGQWVAFTRLTPGGTADVFLQSLGDQTAVQLTRDLGNVGCPAFSPDGTMIAFSQLGGPGGIYVMGRMGGNVRRLTSRGFNPSWSPDGRTIAFGLEFRGANPYRRSLTSLELMTVDVATGQENGTGVRDAVQPAWSPNGHRIAYWGLNDQAWRDIYTTAVNGTERVPVTSDVHVDHSPAWSPDGQWLYFASTRGGPMAIWRVRIDERTGKPLGDPQALTAGGLTEPSFFSLSRDGRRLVYHELLAQTRIDAYGFDPDTLQMDASRTPVVEGSRRLTEMDVSPDGQWLVYRTEDTPQDIYIVRTDGSDTRQITNDAFKDWRPRWSPDSRRLAFYSNASGRYQIWVINRDGSGRMRLTDATVGNTYDPVWSPDGAEIMYFEFGVDSYIVQSTVPFDRQTPRLVPKQSEKDRQVIVRASDWKTGTIAADGVRLYSPATRAFESLVIGGGVADPLWMHDARRVYYRRGPPISGWSWFVLDSKTRIEKRIAGPERVEGAEQFVLSADSRRAFLLSLGIQGDVWRMDIK